MAASTACSSNGIDRDPSTAGAARSGRPASRGGSITTMPLPQLLSRSKAGAPECPSAKMVRAIRLSRKTSLRLSLAFSELHAVTGRHQPSRQGRSQHHVVGHHEDTVPHDLPPLFVFPPELRKVLAELVLSADDTPSGVGGRLSARQTRAPYSHKIGHG